jgi:hypothetical protein
VITFVLTVIISMLPPRASCLVLPVSTARRTTRWGCERVLLFSTLQGDKETKADETVDLLLSPAGNADSIESAVSNSTSSHRKRPQPPPPPPPPGPETFPSWSYEPRSFFEFELLYESKKSLARVGRIHTVSIPLADSVMCNVLCAFVD